MCEVTNREWGNATGGTCSKCPNARALGQSYEQNLFVGWGTRNKIGKEESQPHTQPAWLPLGALSSRKNQTRVMHSDIVPLVAELVSCALLLKKKKG